MKRGTFRSILPLPLDRLAAIILLLLLNSCTVKIFNTKADSTITLTSLMGGQVVDDDADVSITWSAGEVGSGSISLEYSLDSGSSWTSIVADEANDGSYTWRTPTVATNEPNARIRLIYTDASGKTTMVSSATDFVIDALSPTVSLITVTGAALTLRASGQALIVWNASDDHLGSTPIKLEYSTTGSSGPWTVISSQESNDGVYLWSIPSTTSAQYRVRVTATDDAGHSTEVMSSADFTVSSTALAISPTTFNPSISNSTSVTASGRWHTRAVKLSDGKILLAGGQKTNSTTDFLSTTTIFDPTTGNLSGAAPMFSKHTSGHTLTVLADGKVLVCGGYSASALSTSSAGVFNPSDNRWQATAAMSTDRTWHTATLLNDGRVLVTGGVRIPSNTVLQSTVFYDPYARVWYAGPNLSTARYGHGAVKLPDGRVLVMGGDDGSTRLTSAEIFDPSTNSFTATGAMTGAGRMQFGEPILLTDAEAGASFPEGAVFVGGGYDGTSYLNTTTLFDIDTGTWSAGATMAAARRYPSFVKLSDGKIFVAGGEIASTPDQTTSVEYYDVSAGSWTARTPLSSASTYGDNKKSKHASILLNDGRVFLFGGAYGNPELAQPWSMLYDPIGNAWTQGPAFGVPRNLSSTVKLTMGPHAGKIMTCGGMYDNDSALPRLNLCEFYDPETNQIINAPTMNVRRERMRMVDLGDGRLVFMGGGGYSIFGILMKDVEIYDQLTNTWSAGQDMPLYMRDGFGVKLPGAGNKILYMGGIGGGTNTSTGSLSNAVVYDADTDNWTNATSMPAARSRIRAVVTSNGRIFVHGGYDGANAVDSLYEYNPGTTPGVDDSWTTLTGSTSVHAWHTMHTYDLGGNPYLIVFGGYSDGGLVNAVSTVKVYDVTGGTWATGASIPQPRALHFSSELPNGNFVLAGGYVNGGYSTIYEYTPGTIPGTNDGWATHAPNFSQIGGNVIFSGAILDDGRIYLSGGVGGGGGQTAWGRVAEIYSRVSTQTFTASGGDENFTFSLTSGPGTFYSLLRQYIPTYPLESGGTTSTVRVTDGESSTSDATITY